MNRKWSLNLIVLFIACLITEGNCQLVPYPGIPNPTITFLNDSVVRLDYDSIYQVHSRWDSVQHPGEVEFKKEFYSYNYTRIFSDLMTVLDARQYHYIPIY